MAIYLIFMCCKKQNKCCEARGDKKPDSCKCKESSGGEKPIVAVKPVLGVPEVSVGVDSV